MIQTNQPESAFPSTFRSLADPDGEQQVHRWGMQLRDYFAAHAPNPPETWRAKKDEAANIIAWRWAYADEMLKAREA